MKVVANIVQEGTGSLDPSNVTGTLQKWVDLAVNFLATRGLELATGIVSALAIFVVGRWVARLLIGILRRVLTRRGVDPTLVGFLANVSYMLLLAFVCIAAINALGVDTTSLAAIVAAAGLAVGFALQGSLGNFAAGVMIIIFKPFKVGDFIEGGGTAGSVVEVGVFATVVKTPDNKKIIVPNSGLTGGNIINYSANDTRRVDMVFGIAYDDDIQRAKDTLQRLVDADQRILEDPAPKIAVSQLADSSVNLVCRPWVKTPDYWDVFFDLTEKGKLALEEQGITIPFPQRDVHLHQAS